MWLSWQAMETNTPALSTAGDTSRTAVPTAVQHGGGAIRAARERASGRSAPGRRALQQMGKLHRILLLSAWC